jgi:hypothetical protein
VSGTDPHCQILLARPSPRVPFCYASCCQIVKPTAAMVANSTVGLTTTLDPLPPVLRHGLIAVAFFGLLSLISCVALFTFLTYRLAVWWQRGVLRDGANQFLILVYNLVLADLQQSLAFSMPLVYLSQNKIEVGTTTCWANGWFVSTGDLASGVFIFAIALHTYFALVRGRRVSNTLFYAVIGCLWVFVYLMAIIGIGMDKKIYARAVAWVSLGQLASYLDSDRSRSVG